MTEDLRRLTAYHEAGHAVAHWWLHIPFRYVTLRPRDPDAFGLVQGYPRSKRIREHASYGTLTLADRDRIEREAVIFFAGAVAEERAKGELLGPDYIGGSHDNACAVDGLDYLVGPNRAAQALTDYLWVVAQDLVDHWWPAVEAVAEALLKRGTLWPKDVARLAQEAGPSGG